MSEYQQEAIDRLQVSISEYMAQEIDKAILAERERIIALLEAWLNDDYGDFNATLALIKGENNE